MELILSWVTVFTLIVLGIIWNTNSLPNLFIKVVLVVLAIMNLVMLLIKLGYIIKVG